MNTGGIHRFAPYLRSVAQPPRLTCLAQSAGSGKPAQG
jgi:hypothetical protein